MKAFSISFHNILLHHNSARHGIGIGDKRYGKLRLSEFSIK